MKILCFDVGTKTLSYCLLQFIPVENADADITVLEWETINIHQENGVSEKAKPTMKEDSEYVMNCIHRRSQTLWGHNPDFVMVEQQPAGGRNMFSSVRMKSLSHVIHAYFYTHQLHHGGEIRVPVGFVSPSLKLVGLETGESQEDAEARRAGDRKAMGAKYRKNKQFAVQRTQALVDRMPGENGHQARMTLAAATPKKDDLSDAFMLAYSFGLKQSGLRKTATRKRKRND